MASVPIAELVESGEQRTHGCEGRGGKVGRKVERKRWAREEETMSD